MKAINRRILASSTAVAILCCGTAVNASADRDMMKLVVSDVTVHGSLGEEDIYATDGGETLIKIHNDDIESLRTTGELTYDVIQMPAELSDLYSDQMFRGGGYAQAVALDENSELVGKYFVHFDDDANAIEVIGNPSVDDYVSITSDGYIVSFEQTVEMIDGERAFTLSFSMKAPDGTVNTAQLTELYGYTFWLPRFDEDFITVITNEGIDKDYEAPEGTNLSLFTDSGAYHIYMNGKVDKVVLPEQNYYSDRCSGENYVYEYIYNLPRAYEVVYMYETGEMYDDTNIGSSLSKAAQEKFSVDYSAFGGLRGLGKRAYGNKAVAEFAVNDSSYYALINLENGALLSDIYQDMTTEDGEIYAVTTVDDKYGFVDADGKLLASYDKAGLFYGDYAPVVENGKAYLVDRGMNRVSEMVESDDVWSLSEELFAIEIDGESHIATYVAADEPVEEPTDKPAEEPTDTPAEEPADTPAEEPADTPAEEPTDTPIDGATDKPTDVPTEGTTGSADSDKGSPDTGVEGVAVALGAVIAAGAAVILSRKRK